MKMQKWFCIAVIFIFSSGSLLGAGDSTHKKILAVVQQTGQVPEAVPGEYLLESRVFAEHVGLFGTVPPALWSAGARKAERLNEEVILVEFAEGASRAVASETLGLELVPNRVLVQNLEAPKPVQGDPLPWPPLHIQRLNLAPLVEGIGPNPATVLVPVLDSGIRCGQPQVQPRLDMNKVQSFVDDQPCLDETWHGTTVAITVCGLPNPSGATRGVVTGPGCEVANLKILKTLPGNNGSTIIYTTESAILQAFGEVAKWKGRPMVVVASFLVPDSPLIGKAIRTLRDTALIVAAAGNAGSYQLPAPAVYGSEPHVLTVGSTDCEGRPSVFSNKGPAVGIGACGEGIALPMASGVTGMFSGTSFAGPSVAGLAVLVLQRWPDTPPWLVKKIIQAAGWNNPLLTGWFGKPKQATGALIPGVARPAFASWVVDIRPSRLTAPIAGPELPAIVELTGLPVDDLDGLNLRVRLRRMDGGGLGLETTVWGLVFGKTLSFPMPTPGEYQVSLVIEDRETNWVGLTVLPDTQRGRNPRPPGRGGGKKRQ